LTAFVSDTTIVLVEDCCLPAPRQFGMVNPAENEEREGNYAPHGYGGEVL